MDQDLKNAKWTVIFFIMLHSTHVDRKISVLVMSDAGMECEHASSIDDSHHQDEVRLFVIRTALSKTSISQIHVFVFNSPICR